MLDNIVKNAMKTKASTFDRYVLVIHKESMVEIFYNTMTYITLHSYDYYNNVRIGKKSKQFLQTMSKSTLFLQKHLEILDVTVMKRKDGIYKSIYGSWKGIYGEGYLLDGDTEPLLGTLFLSRKIEIPRTHFSWHAGHLWRIGKQLKWFLALTIAPFKFHLKHAQILSLTFLGAKLSNIALKLHLEH